MAIITKKDIEDYLLIKIDNSFNDRLNRWIKAVELHMMRVTDRILVADEVVKTYSYDTTGSNGAQIDDFAEIERVHLGTNDITNSVVYYPPNDWPKWRVETSDRRSLGPAGQQNLKITGKRGCYFLSEFPEDLKFVAVVLVAGIVNSHYNYGQQSVVSSESIGRWSISYSNTRQREDYKEALNLLKHYRRIR